MDALISTWYLSAIPVFIDYTTCIIFIVKAKAVLDEVGKTIRSTGDLNILKPVIELNMKLDITLLSSYSLCFLVGLYFIDYKKMFLDVGAYHMFNAIGALLPIFIYEKKFESRIRNLKPESDAPEVEETFHRWLKQWSQFGWRLPD